MRPEWPYEDSVPAASEFSIRCCTWMFMTMEEKFGSRVAQDWIFEMLCWVRVENAGIEQAQVASTVQLECHMQERDHSQQLWSLTKTPLTSG